MSAWLPAADEQLQACLKTFADQSQGQPRPPRRDEKVIEITQSVDNYSPFAGRPPEPKGPTPTP
jgi:hypothetical protein